MSYTPGNERHKRNTQERMTRREWRKEIVCPTGKIVYYSIHTAERKRREMWLEGDQSALEVYQCPYCEEYHLGHESEDVRKHREVITQRYKEEREKI